MNRFSHRLASTGIILSALLASSPLPGGGLAGVAEAFNERYLSRLLSNRTLVTDGSSLELTSLFELRYNESEHSVRCIINVENWSSWILSDPLASPDCGYITPEYSPVEVFPGTREVIEGYKMYGTATGTCGTVSWQLEGLKLRLIVMWSVPFNLQIRDSYLAIGMVYNEGRFSSADYWFNQMYYGTHGPFKRSMAGQAITFENDKIVVHGFMESDTYSPLLNISVIPQTSYRLAPSIFSKAYEGQNNFLFPSSAPSLPLDTCLLPSLPLATCLLPTIIALAVTQLAS